MMKLIYGAVLAALMLISVPVQAEELDAELKGALSELFGRDVDALLVTIPDGLPWWAEGEADASPMPPDEQLLGAIMLEIYHCTQNADDSYTCPLQYNGVEMAVKADPHLRVWRQDGKKVAIPRAANGENSVHCGLRHIIRRPLERTFRQTCTVNDVPVFISFSLFETGGEET